MRRITLPEIGTFAAWRSEARALIAAGVPPEAVLWSRGQAEADLFAEAGAPVAEPAPLTVPRGFAQLAALVVWHSDPERFAALYALLWRVKRDARILQDRGDAAVDRLNRMAKAVSRDKHKMTAFVRFREIDDPGLPRRRFAAWFEPSHFITEPTAPFFAKRFGDMDWSIFTPHATAHFTAGTLEFAPPAANPGLPEDATEELWRTYFRNIFNPARVKLKAMQAEMPKKYWHNLPEADLIPEMVASARTRARAMAEAAPTLAPERAARITEKLEQSRVLPPPSDDLEALNRDLQGCRRCSLWRDATQAVPGCGPRRAPLMIVGEQPGDQEDLAGRPFVGPAGQLFDDLAQEAGLDRQAAFVTNAVKHFKFQPRGKRRIHQAPDRQEIAQCRWWLDQERALVKPSLILAMGATAVESLTGNRKALLARRGRVEQAADGTPILITTHPSYLLRLPPAERPEAQALFRADLEKAARMLG
jgi:DNA polymerase